MSDVVADGSLVVLGKREIEMMKWTFKSGRLSSTVVVGALIAACLVPMGCATSKGTGTLAGAGLGGVIGGAAGGTKYAVIGAAAGAGVGYLIGDKKDKEHAEELEAQNAAAKRAAELHAEVGDLGGTRWNVISLTPEPEDGPYVLKVIEFGNDSHVRSTTTMKDGDQKVWTENYRVVGNTLIVNRKGVLVNVRFNISGKTLTLEADKFKAVLEKI